jgi:hypothetical protein
MLAVDSLLLQSASEIRNRSSIRLLEIDELVQCSNSCSVGLCCTYSNVKADPNKLLSVSIIRTTVVNFLGEKGVFGKIGRGQHFKVRILIYQRFNKQTNHCCPIAPRAYRYLVPAFG